MRSKMREAFAFLRFSGFFLCNSYYRLFGRVGLTTVGWSFRLLPFKSQQNRTYAHMPRHNGCGLQLVVQSFLFEVVARLVLVLAVAFLDKETRMGEVRVCTLS